jgi:addiction module HigA family antidote
MRAHFSDKKQYITYCVLRYNTRYDVVLGIMEKPMLKTPRSEADTPGQYLRRTVLEAKKITITEAARLLGVGRPTLSNVLNGKVAVSKDMAARIERAFGSPAEKLLELQAAHDAGEAKAKGPPPQTRAYVPHFLGIKALEIEAWASNIAARVRLSVLLRTLIHSTGIGLTGVDFPGNDDAERPGWDGFAIASEGTPWIPEGQSGWEFGTNQEPKAKADGDYTKAVKSTSKEDRAKTTFIFVTPRRWTGKNQWQDARRKEARWKDVRAYDASDLEQWLEQSIAAQAWFADETKRASSNGVHSLDREWTEWANASNPPLPGALFDAAVRDETKKIKDRLSRPPDGPTIIAADSIGEALAFLSQLFREGNTGLAAFRDRIAVFHEPGVLPKLAEGNSEFIAIAATAEVEREFAPHVHKLHSFVSYPRNAVNVEPHVVLEPLNHEAFRSGLEAMGKTRDDIERLGHESGRSLTVLRRRVSTLPSVRNPEWAAQPHTAQRLVPFLLAGAWDSTRDSDQTILSLLASGASYPGLEKDFHALTGLSDPPVWSAGTYRGVVSKMDLLFAICSAVTRSDLETYFDVAHLVLSEDDPSLDLPEKERWKAGIFGKTRELSPALRQGISETLVLLAVYGNTLFQSSLGINVEAHAAKLVRSLLTPLTTRSLEAHEADLRTYAEAAPDEFLRILEADLKTTRPASIGLMRPADSGIFAKCPRSGLLWALEGLAWAPGTFARAVFILARLSQVKIDDNWGNKPIASLGSIFRAWMPQTAATLDQRLKVMDLLAERYPAIAWQICVEQIDGRNTVGRYSDKPRWRNDGNGFGEPDAQAGYPFYIKMIATALQWKQHDKQTLSDLVEMIYVLNEEQQKTVWQLISRWASAAASDNDKAYVREKIRVTVMSRRGAIRNEKYDKAEALVAAANEAYTALEPADIFNKHEWLFRQDWVEESADEINAEDMDFHKREERIAALRTEALRDILSAHGLDGVFKLAEMGKAPGRIGYLMASILSPTDLSGFILAALPEGTDTWTRKNLVFGALHAFTEREPRDVVLRSIQNTVPESEFIRILQLAPFDGNTWKIVRELGEPAGKAYWAGIVPPQLPPDSDEDINDGVGGLLEAKRPRAAFSFVHLKLKKLKPALLFRLMSEVAVGHDEPVGRYQPDGYYITEAFKLLEASGEFSVDQLAGLEFPYIDVLSRQVGAQEAHGIPNLELYIQDHPELFVDAVAWLYQRRDGGDDPKELKLDQPDKVSNRAQRGMALLDALERIPGVNEAGQADVGKLRAWVNTVREFCAALGRAEAGDRSLGKLFSNAPRGEDGVWPCEPVREVLEEVQSDAISRGMVLGVYNARGAHFRAEGGDAEYALAQKYRNWAQALEFSHPFIAATILKPLTNTYEQEGTGHDTESRIQRRLSL